MSKVYTDVFNIKHTDCTVVDTINEFSRIFIIQDKHGSRFTCLKDDARPAKKGSGHWTSASPGRCATRLRCAVSFKKTAT